MKLSWILASGRRPLLATAAILAVLFTVAAVLYPPFLTARVLLGMFSDYAFLGIAGVGTTLVIFSGGIDLSVGAVIGFTSIFTAVLIGRHGVPVGLAWGLALGVGAAFGAVMGALIHGFSLPPFLVTLAGMFLARGGAFWISTDSVGIRSAVYDRVGSFQLGMAGLQLPAPALALLVVLTAGYLIAHHTRFGRNLLAIGGSENSALLMGLPIGATKIGVYALNGFGAALAGLVATLYTGSGNPNFGRELELDAIAIVVIGGTLLTGGRGHMLGTFFGLAIYGIIQEAILFDGRLDPWWSRIVVGLLLLGFILLQRLLARKRS